MKNIRSGVIYAAVSTFFAAAVALIQKFALYKGLNAETFAVFWFGSAFFYCRFYITFSGQNEEWRASLSHWRIIIIIGVIESACALFWLEAISQINVAVASFLASTNLVFVFFLGFIFLRERFNLVEMFGVLLVFIGAPLMSFTSEGGEWLPIIYVLSSAVFYSVNTIIIKKYLGRISPIVMSTWRSAMIFICASIYMLLRESFTYPSVWLVVATCVASGLGPFLNMWAYFEALKLIEASKVVLIRAASPLFVLVGTALILNDMPKLIKIIGGTVLLIGVVVLTLGKMKAQHTADTLAVGNSDGGEN